MNRNGEYLSFILRIFLGIVIVSSSGYPVYGAQHKQDPEPPKRPSGQWEGTWGTMKFKAYLNSDGSYYDLTEGTPYAGIWRLRKRSNVLEITLDPVPLNPTTKDKNTYSFKLSKHRNQAVGTNSDIKMYYKGRLP